jgi:hypothetical protein
MKKGMHVNTPSPAGNAALSRFTKKQSRLTLALTVTATLLTPALFAQGWYTVDNFQYSVGTNAVASGLAADPTGTVIYSAGYGQDTSGIDHALAFKSIDGGTNWALIDDYTATISPYGDEYRGIATDSTGNIYAVGYDQINAGSVQTWFTRRSADRGSTWSTVDTLAFGTEVARPFAVAADMQGNVYVVGGVQTNAGGGSWLWLVRKGTGGISWATVDQLGTQTNLLGPIPYGVFCHPTAGVFVVGKTVGQPVTSKRGTSYPVMWTVRRSQDSGTSWRTVDTYNPNGAAYTSSAQGGGVDSAGNIYVVGTTSAPGGMPHTTAWHWIVRKSSDGGNSWATVDDFENPYQAAWPSAFGRDANGNLFVGG